MNNDTMNNILERAASLIERMAADMKESTTVNGTWEDDHYGAEEEYKEMMEVASQLRSLC